MPELPEVETTLRGIQPYIEHNTIKKVIIRHPRLRWPILKNLPEKICGKKITSIQRRGKYLLLNLNNGTLILHLGMSGSLRILTQQTAPQKHDHFDIEFSNNIILRFTDPRRFGALLWTEENPDTHSLLKNLGPEPLTNAFTANYLWERAQNRNIPIKTFIMDSKIVVGVGNIYATEALFSAGIYPTTAAKTLSKNRLEKLVKAIKMILRSAIKQGGTTLKDFTKSDGKPGYFINKLKVYGRTGLPCIKCGRSLQAMIVAQRNTVFCGECQK